MTLVIPGSSSLTSSTNFAPSRWFSAAPGLSWLTGYWNGGPDSSAGAPAETPSDPADDETEYDFFENRRVPDRQAHYLLYIHISGAWGPMATDDAGKNLDSNFKVGSLENLSYI